MHTNLRLPEKILQVFLCFFSFLCMLGSARIPFLTGSISVRSLLAGCFVLVTLLLKSYLLIIRGFLYADEKKLVLHIFWMATILFALIREAHPRHSVTYLPFITLLCIVSGEKHKV